MEFRTNGKVDLLTSTVSSLDDQVSDIPGSYMYSASGRIGQALGVPLLGDEPITPQREGHNFCPDDRLADHHYCVWSALHARKYKMVLD